MGILSGLGVWRVGGRRPVNSAIGRRIALAIPSFFLLMPALSLTEQVATRAEDGSWPVHDASAADDAAGRRRDGVLDRLEPCVGDTSQYDSADVPKSIPDVGSVESTLVVPDTGATDDIDVRLDVSHPFDSDLLIELISPAGNPVTLADSVGMWGDDFTGTIFDDEAQDSVISVLPPFDGRLRPTDPLSDLDGADRAGNWILRVTDQRGDYTGSIIGWGLDITTCPDALASSRARTDREAAGRLPKRCGRVGAPPAPPLPQGVPAGEEETRGTLITLTTNSEAADGDVSSVPALQANPGADGLISLREAIEATNNDPGEYTVRFSPSLAGDIIGITNNLPPLSGGGVFVNGDIDGDGRPDVTIEAVNPARGLVITSSGNRLHALALRGFDGPVFFGPFIPGDLNPPSTGKTFSNTVLTGLVLDAGVDGILHVTASLEGASSPPQETHNSWFDTRIIGNTIESQRGGVMIGITGVGDLEERTTIANNTVHVSYEGDRMDHDGIGLTIGAFPYSTDNRLSDLVVAYNSVEGGPDYGVRINTGVVGATSNISEGIRIVGNHVHLTPVTWLSGEARGGVLVGAGEGSERACPGCDAIIYSEDNVARNFEISGNVLGGPGGAAIGLFAGVSGAARNRVEDVHIEDNRIRGVAPSTGSGQSGVWIEGGFGSGYLDKSSADNVVSDVTVHANSITLRPDSSEAQLTSGGIAVIGGVEANSGDVRDVLITNNRVNTKFVGITFVGGRAGQLDAKGNEVSHVRARCNVIGRDPMPFTGVEPKVNGINLAGGIALDFTGPGSATGNKVTCIRLRDNLVAGVLNDVSVLPNLGTGASRNVASRGGC